MITVYINNNQIDVDTFTFNGGEEHVRIGYNSLMDARSVVEITAKIQSSSDLVKLLMINDAIDRVSYVKSYKVLTMLYTPYARQDRVCNKGEALSISVLANLINSMNFDKVQLLMPHSDVSTALIKNVQLMDNLYENYVYGALKNQENDSSNIVIVAPDGGAIKRTFNFANKFKFEMITAEKVRDTMTGKIIHTEVFCGDLTGKTCVIYDDICDGGRTFIELAKKLKEHNAEKIVLAVAHGIFSQGLDVFDGYIDRIITSNSVDFGNRIAYDSFLKVIEIR